MALGSSASESLLTTRSGCGDAPIRLSGQEVAGRSRRLAARSPQSAGRTGRTPERTRARRRIRTRDQRHADSEPFNRRPETPAGPARPAPGTLDRPAALGLNGRKYLTAGRFLLGAEPDAIADATLVRRDVPRCSQNQWAEARGTLGHGRGRSTHCGWTAGVRHLACLCGSRHRDRTRGRDQRSRPLLSPSPTPRNSAAVPMIERSATGWPSTGARKRPPA